MYTVVRDFIEKFDGGRLYKTGTQYPRKGFKPAAGRIEMLSTNKNSYGTTFIVKEDVKKAEEKQE